MRALITGGAGFIGGHLTEALLKNGHEVTAIDNLSTGSLSNLQKASGQKGFRFIQQDITDSSFDLAREVKNCDVIFHLAAAVGVELVVHDPVRTLHTNVHGTESVLLPAAKYGKRIIVASTSEVYGKSAGEFFRETDDLLIGCPTHSRWSYACSKLMDEFYVMAYYKQMGLRGTVVRFFNTVGPRQTGQYGMVIPRFVERALRNAPLQVYGDGTQTRCFCHVFDTVRALLLLAENEATYGQIYNIGGQESISMLALAQKVIAQLHSKSEIKLIAYSEAYEAGFEDMLHRAPDTAKIHDLTQWTVQHDLTTIINDVAANFIC